MPERWMVRNIARRPVELHATDGSVAIVPPDGSIILDAIEPQCRALIDRGLLTLHEAKAKAPAAAPVKRRAKRGGGAKKAGPPRSAAAKPAKPAKSAKPKSAKLPSVKRRRRKEEPA